MLGIGLFNDPESTRDALCWTFYLGIEGMGPVYPSNQRHCVQTWCVCECLHVSRLCVRALGRVTINSRLVNSHQREQTVVCLHFSRDSDSVSVSICVAACVWMLGI